MPANEIAASVAGGAATLKQGNLALPVANLAAHFPLFATNFPPSLTGLLCSHSLVTPEQNFVAECVWLSSYSESAAKSGIGGTCEIHDVHPRITRAKHWAKRESLARRPRWFKIQPEFRCCIPDGTPVSVMGDRMSQYEGRGGQVVKRQPAPDAP
jgi:hypothetical protein